MFIKSPLNYIGGKYQLLSTLTDIFPDNIGTFVDLFAGGFNVGINIIADTIICNDHRDYLIDMYKYFRSKSENDILNSIYYKIQEYDLNQENKDGYDKLRFDYNKTPNSLDLFVLSCYSFNHQIRFNNNKQFNTPFGKNRSSYNKKIEQNLILFIKALKEKNIRFFEEDFINVNLDNLNSNDFVYCDPPYLISTGSYNDGNRGFKNWTDKEELLLLNLLDKLNNKGVKFALSNVLYHKNQENKLLINWCKKYHITYVKTKYSNCNYHLKAQNKNANTTEVVITNYKVPGDNYGDKKQLYK